MGGAATAIPAVSAPAAPTPGRSERPGWRDISLALRQPKMLAALLLGFGSGLPYLLTSLTLGYWLRQEGVQLATIGFVSWIGMVYSFKILWAPMVDQVDVPLLGRWLGRRRGWILLAQIVVGAGLVGMAIVGPSANLAVFAGFALLTAFASTIQDISGSAWRIEIADSKSEIALISAVTSVGSRIGFVIADALILIAAGFIGWPLSYMSMGVAMGVGMIGVILAHEPPRHLVEHVGAAARSLGARIATAFIEPFLTFFRERRGSATLLLAMIAVYRLTDMMMIPMMAPLYVDLGFNSAQIGAMRGTFGMVGTIGGVIVGGLMSVRWGVERTLIAGAIVAPITNFTYVVLCLIPGGPEFWPTGAVIFVENLATGFAGAAGVAYMSTLIGPGFAATQFALLGSVQSMLGKFVRGFSGATVDWLQQSMSLMNAYAFYFAVTAVLGIPAILLSVACARRTADLRS